MDNRRASHRFKLYQMVQINYENEEIFINARTENISLGGLMCKVDEEIKTVVDIFLMFELIHNNREHLIKCFVEISWQKRVEDGYLVGLKFVSLHKDDREVLENYLETLPK